MPAVPPGFMQPGVSASPPPQPARPPRFSDEFKAYVSEYVQNWMHSSAKAVEQKLWRWRLLDEIYHNQRSLKNWYEPIHAVALDPQVVDKAEWRTNFIVSTAAVINSFTDRMYNAIFAQPDAYQRVVAEPWLSEDGTPNAEDYHTIQKFESLLFEKNRQAFFKPRIHVGLGQYAKMGTDISKIFYFTQDRWRWMTDPLSGAPMPQLIRKEFPIIQSVPLDMSLPDWKAKSSDCQNDWDGIGNRLYVPVSHVLDRFDQGVYDTNREEFEKQYPLLQKSPMPGLIQLYSDPYIVDSEDISQVHRVCLWEWHGEVPIPAKWGGGIQELICTHVTATHDHSPVGSLMIRCSFGPALETGDRPYTVAHFTPLPSPFGNSHIENNMHLVYYMSHIINLMLDNARLGGNAMLKVRENSKPHLALNKTRKSPTVYPGKVWPVVNPDDVTPFEPFVIPEQALSNIFQYFQRANERETSVNDNTLALQSKAQTATEAYRIGQMADVPLETRINLFTEYVMEPFGRISLGMLQNRLQGPQPVMIQGSDGRQRVQEMINPDELRTGRYRVVASVNRPDQAQIARLQSLERMLPNVIQARIPALQDPENPKWISITAWLEAYVDELNPPNKDQIFTDVTPEQAQQLLWMLAPPPPPEPTGPEKGSPSNPTEEPRQLGIGGTPNGPDNSDASMHAQLMQNIAQIRRGQLQ